MNYYVGLANSYGKWRAAGEFERGKWRAAGGLEEENEEPLGNLKEENEELLGNLEEENDTGDGEKNQKLVPWFKWIYRDDREERRKLFTEDRYLIIDTHMDIVRKIIKSTRCDEEWKRERSKVIKLRSTIKQTLFYWLFILLLKILLS